MRRPANHHRVLAGLAALLAASLLVGGTPAVAQAVTGSHIKRKEAGATSAIARGKSQRAAFNALARCRAELFEPNAVAALSAAFESAEQEAAIARMHEKSETLSGECFSADNIETNGALGSYAGAYAEYLIARRFTAADVKALTSEQARAWSVASFTPRNAFERFGNCIVQARTTEVHGLSQAVPDSPAETAALQAIMPALGPCVLAGQEARFNRSRLRAILSVALYRALHDHRQYLKVGAGKTVEADTAAASQGRGSH